MNLKTEFLTHSQDFLRLLGEKVRRAENNTTIAAEMNVMEHYHDGVEAIINNYETQLQAAQLAVINRTAVYKMLEKEYEKLFTELFKPIQDPLKSMTEKQLHSAKIKYKSGKVTIWQVCQHFNLSDEQIKFIQDGR